MSCNLLWVPYSLHSIMKVLFFSQISNYNYYPSFRIHIIIEFMVVDAPSTGLAQGGAAFTFKPLSNGDVVFATNCFIGT